MKDKKIIAYKNERVKKFAYNLRKLIIDVVMGEWSRLCVEQRGKPTSVYLKIEDERSDLLRMLRASIYECPCCHQAERDMYFNGPMQEWFCTQCVQKYRDYYQKQKAIHGDLKVDDDDFYVTFL